MIKVEIDLSRCQGYGNCVTAAPDVFDIDDEGQAFLLVEESMPDEELARMKAAAAVCPVTAITVNESLV